MNKAKHWTEFEIHQIAFLSSRGWKTFEFVDGWTKSGPLNEMLSLNAAYEEELYSYEEEQPGDTLPAPSSCSTMPSPPNPIIGLVDLLKELCEWYDEQPAHLHNRLPHDLFSEVANRIGYKLKG